MSQLETFIALAGVWICLAWVPYILDRIKVRGLTGALANYSPDAAPQSDWAQRAMRAHTVAIESFAAFAPLAILASIRLPEDGLTGALGAIYFFAILAHYVIYCLGIPVIRTLSFAVAAISTLLIGLRVLGVI